jgi:hypothetical protein
MSLREDGILMMQVEQDSVLNVVAPYNTEELQVAPKNVLRRLMVMTVHGETHYHGYHVRVSIRLVNLLVVLILNVMKCFQVLLFQISAEQLL